MIENTTCVWTTARRNNVGAILHDSDSNKDQYQQPFKGSESATNRYIKSHAVFFCRKSGISRTNRSKQNISGTSGSAAMSIENFS